MIKGFLQSFDSNLEVNSAGTQQAEQVIPHAIKAMREMGIVISNHYPKMGDHATGAYLFGIRKYGDSSLIFDD